MVVANEKNLFYRLRQGGEFKRNEMFDMLVQGSKGFLKGGKGMIMSGNLQNTTHFGFWMDGYWQGAYDQYIQVSLNAYASTVGNYVLRTLNCRESTSHTVNCHTATQPHCKRSRSVSVQKWQFSFRDLVSDLTEPFEHSLGQNSRYNELSVHSGTPFSRCMHISP